MVESIANSRKLPSFMVLVCGRVPAVWILYSPISLAVQITEEKRVAADGLTVRVINNITKKLDVKPKFLETFRNEGYPEQFQYKQKVRTGHPHTSKQAKTAACLSLSHSWP